jgi:hypothetical protein
MTSASKQREIVGLDEDKQKPILNKEAPTVLFCNPNACYYELMNH